MAESNERRPSVHVDPPAPAPGAAVATPIETRLSVAQLRELTESLPHLVWTCLAEGPCDYLSRQWIEYTGIPEAEQLGYGWLLRLHADDRERVKAEWAAAVGAATPFDIEFRIRRADGVFRWFRTRAIPLRDPEGRIVKWYGSNTDIDAYKRTEESLRLSEMRFRQAITAAPIPSMIRTSERLGPDSSATRPWNSASRADTSSIGLCISESPATRVFRSRPSQMGSGWSAAVRSCRMAWAAARSCARRTSQGPRCSKSGIPVAVSSPA